MIKFIKSVGLTVIFLASIILVTTDTYAASVKKVIKRKTVVVIDEGKSAGVAKGDRYCFYNDSGKKLGCGKVRRVKKKVAYVKVKKKVGKKVKRGFEAIGPGGSSGSGGSSGKSFAIRAFFGGTITTPTEVTLPQYTPEKQDSDPYWTPNESVGTSLQIGGEFEYIPFNLAVGARYMISGPAWATDMDYTEKGGSEYLNVQQTTSAFGLWADYLYPISLGSSSLHVGAGLDIDMSSVSMIADQLTEGSEGANPIVSFESSVTAFSLRVPIRFDFPVGPVKLNLGGALTVGLAGTPSYAGEVQDSQSSDPDLYLADLSTAVGNTPGFGTIGYLGVGFEF